ncbi:response regulator [Leptolyngbya sp. 7M]|nr:response regulator [Leptolyngbya sp. 7M]
MEEPAAEQLILIVEDNPDHIQTIQQTLAQTTLQPQIIAIGNGEQAMQLLRQQGDYASTRRPDLILLDLNLPGKDGRELLAELKADPQLRRIPVVVLTMSSEAADILNSYTLQGNCYVIKSSDLEQLAQIVKRIEEFWLEIVTLPESKRSHN